MSRVVKGRKLARILRTVEPFLYIGNWSVPKQTTLRLKRRIGTPVNGLE